MKVTVFTIGIIHSKNPKRSVNLSQKFYIQIITIRALGKITFGFLLSGLEWFHFV